jgi:2-haloacid dehalogenase
MTTNLKNKTKACVFDAYGTLLDVASAAMQCTDEINVSDRLLAPQLAQIWRTKQLEYTWLRSLMGAHVDFWQITGDGLDYAMETLGIDNPDLREKLMALYHQLDAFPEVHGVLRQLKDAGFQTAILSNGSPDMLQGAIDHSALNDVLDAVYSIESVGVYKPDPRVYQMAVDGLGVSRDNITFLSSNAWDVAGAAHFGFSVIWVNRYHQAAERLPGKPLHQISTLDGLPALLGL